MSDIGQMCVVFVIFSDIYAFRRDLELEKCVKEVRVLRHKKKQYICLTLFLK